LVCIISSLREKERREEKEIYRERGRDRKGIREQEDRREKRNG
jgi:hypothetical protein